jgi:predicted membrane protein
MNMVRVILKVFAVVVLINVVVNVVRVVVRKQMPSIGDEQSDEIDLMAFMDGIALKSNATEFRGGSVRAVFGGIDLDLADVHLDSLGASLDVRAIFGGVRLIVPAGCKVDVAARSIAGGVDDLTGELETTTEGPVLYLSATSLMGGIQVLYPPPQSEFGEITEVI